MVGKLQQLYVRYIYADHNSSQRVRDALREVISNFEPGQRGLNVGAGDTELHPQIENLDIVAGPAIDHVGSVESLPFSDDAFDLVITQETLEHVADPWQAIREIARILKPGGVLYCQLPFVIGYHPGPEDYWRFTVAGISQLLMGSGLVIASRDIAVGGATGYYRISVEFWSILLSFGVRPVYRLLKAAFALVLYPIKWLDALFNRSPELHRIAGGYFVVARKQA